eukprot:COSAG05_NODE_1027_length_6117_cov_7.351778_6_plen_229_part_00
MAHSLHGECTPKAITLSGICRYSQLSWVQRFTDGDETEWRATVQAGGKRLSDGVWQGACDGTFTARRLTAREARDFLAPRAPRLGDSASSYGAETAAVLGAATMRVGGASAAAAIAAEVERAEVEGRRRTAVSSTRTGASPLRGARTPRVVSPLRGSSISCGAWTQRPDLETRSPSLSAVRGLGSPSRSSWGGRELRLEESSAWAIAGRLGRGSSPRDAASDREPLSI